MEILGIYGLPGGFSLSGENDLPLGNPDIAYPRRRTRAIDDRCTAE
jgi:hypothetical protein